ncbi:MAG: Undecaprenyl-phosphate mannosyltransferase, partial [uncultured Gemmatimonadetes bacterium]
AARARRHPDVQREGQPPAARSIDPLARSAAGDPGGGRRLAGRHRRHGRRDRRGRAPRARAPSRGQAGAGHRVPGRLRLGAGARLRRVHPDGRGLQPRPRAHPPVPARRRGVRPGAGVALPGGPRHRGELAHHAPPPQLLRQRLRPLGHGAPGGRRHGRLQVLPARGAGHAGPGPRGEQRLLLPDRDELPRLEAGLPHRRDPDHVRGQGPGREQDVQGHRTRGHLARVAAAPALRLPPPALAARRERRRPHPPAALRPTGRM